MADTLSNTYSNMSTGNRLAPAAAPRIYRELVVRFSASCIASSRGAADADRGRLAGAGRPSQVAGPVTIPGGQLLMIDYSSTPPRLCCETPGILARHLATAGVRDAQIDLAPTLSEQRYGIVGSLTPVARAGIRASLAPYPDDGFLGGVPLASRLIDTATQWLRGQYHAGMELVDLIISTGVPVTWDNLRPVAESVLASRGVTTLIVSDLATRAAAAVLGAFGHTGISLGVAGPDPAPERVAGHMRGLRAVIRGIAADVGWAGVTAHAAMPPTQNVYRPGRAMQDEFGAGPMWYQVLSRAQLERLRGLPPGATEVAPGRFELTIGEPEQWMPGHGRGRGAGGEGQPSGERAGGGQGSETNDERFHGSVPSGDPRRSSVAGSEPRITTWFG
jgi:hypothetical protein